MKVIRIKKNEYVAWARGTTKSRIKVVSVASTESAKKFQDAIKAYKYMVKYQIKGNIVDVPTFFKCPLCNKGKLLFCQDTIAYHPISAKGEIDHMNNTLEGLDNTWLECNHCHDTSEDSEELKRIFSEEIN